MRLSGIIMESCYCQVDHEKQEIVVKTSNKKYYKRPVLSGPESPTTTLHCMAYTASSCLPDRAVRSQNMLCYFGRASALLRRIQVPDLPRHDLKFKDLAQLTAHKIFCGL